MPAAESSTRASRSSRTATHALMPSPPGNTAEPAPAPDPAPAPVAPSPPAASAAVMLAAPDGSAPAPHVRVTVGVLRDEADVVGAALAGVSA